MNEELVRTLPTVNASLNALATVLLVIGRGQAKRGELEAHKRTMCGAFGLSVLFLASYLVYHAHVGSVRFAHEGPIRTLYLAILGTHIVLAALVPFMAVRTLWLGWKDRRETHVWWARITWPIWLYVSVTGVVIYGMLYHWPGPP